MSNATRASILVALLLLLPAGTAAAQSLDVFVLGPADEIEISVWEEPALSATLIVRPDGRISLPLIGSVLVAGLTPEEVEVELRNQLLTKLTEPIVVVIVREFNSAQVSVLGEVQRPGRFPLDQKLSVLDVIAAAGGFSTYADIDSVIVLRPEEAGIRRIRVNVKALLDNDSEPLLMLMPGDTVYVK